MIYANRVRALFSLTFLLAACLDSADAQTTNGMAAMQYFAGNWACTAGSVKDPTLYKIELTFAIDSGIMREWDAVHVPGQSAIYSISKSISWDTSNNRWVQTQVDDQAQWRVSYLKPWTGNTEEWLDQFSSNGRLGRDETVRIGANDFAFSSFANPGDAMARMVGRCTRTTT